MLNLGNENLERAVHKISEYGKDLGFWEAEYEYLVAMQKTVEAEEFLRLGSVGGTVEFRKASAKTSERVKCFIIKIKEAKEKYIELRHKIKSAEIFTNLYRTVSKNLEREKDTYDKLG